MSPSRFDAASPPAADEPEALQAEMDALRSCGAARFDPARFHFIEALSARLPGQPEPVRRLLEVRLKAALTDYAERFAQTRQPAAEVRSIRPSVAVSGAGKAATPLTQLNAHIRSANAAELAAPGEAQDGTELASVRRFRQAWESGRMLDRMEQAVSRKPAKAGPLNSHALVLDSLAWLQDLSPDYLRRFLVHVESLQWLEQAAAKQPGQPPRPGKPKAARRSRPKE